jgi:hypothetical protein
MAVMPMLGDNLRGREEMERPAGDVLGLELVDAAGSQQAFTPMMRPNLVASQASQDERPPPHTPAVGVLS